MTYEEWIKMKEEAFTKKYGVSPYSNEALVRGIGGSEVIDFLGCNSILNYFEWCKEQELTPPKFPEPCKNCWKVLVFDVSKEEAKYITSKYGRSKHLEMEGNPDKYLVVIYTNSEEEKR